MSKARSKQRLEIAISLLQGKLILREREGYDPGGFRRNELNRTVQGALDMAEALLDANEEIDKPKPDPVEELREIWDEEEEAEKCDAPE